MARGDLTCPIDGQPLGLPNPQLRGNIEVDGTVGSHLHLVVNITLTCSQGHRWRIHGDLLMEREA